MPRGAGADHQDLITRLQSADVFDTHTLLLNRSVFRDFSESIYHKFNKLTKSIIDKIASYNVLLITFLAIDPFRDTI